MRALCKPAYFWSENKKLTMQQTFISQTQLWNCLIEPGRDAKSQRLQRRKIVRTKFHEITAWINIPGQQNAY